jgi:hypothetical protein
VKPPAAPRHAPAAAQHDELEELQEISELKEEPVDQVEAIDEVEVIDEIEEIDEVEEIEEIEEVQEVTGSAPAPKKPANNNHPASHPADDDDPLSALAAMAQPKSPRS